MTVIHVYMYIKDMVLYSRMRVASISDGDEDEDEEERDRRQLLQKMQEIAIAQQQLR